jgi:hypothetical protein
MNFLEILMKAWNIVTAQYPHAQFYEADGRPEGGSGTNPDDVQEWRFVYNIPPGSKECPDTPSNTTVMLRYYKGSFSKPSHVCEPWLEDVIIPLPIKMDLGEAITLMQKAGYTDPFSSVTLRWPLYPGVKEPYYIFGIPAQKVWVFVGVYDSKVHTEPM